MDFNLGKILQQAEQVQSRMAALKDEMGKRTVEASAGGGMVSAVVNGRQQLVGLKIEKEAINPEDPEMLRDLVLAAVNQALRQAQEMMQEEMSKLTGGIKLPGIFP